LFEGLIGRRRMSNCDEKPASIYDGTTPSYLLDNINTHLRWLKFRDDKSFTLDREDVRTILQMLEGKENKNEEEERLFQILFLSFKF
jgi:hypothetical protein